MTVGCCWLNILSNIDITICIFIHYWHLHFHLFRSKNNNNTIKWQKNRTTRHMACSNSCPLNTCQDGRQCFLKELSSSPVMGLGYTVSSPGGSGAELQLKLNLVHFSQKNLSTASGLQLEWLKNTWVNIHNLHFYCTNVHLHLHKFI